MTYHSLLPALVTLSSVSFAACADPVGPAGALEASRRSVHEITAIPLAVDGQLYDNNNRGQVVGAFDVFGVWRSDQLRPLPLPTGWDGVSGNAINSSGDIVGTSVQEGQPFAHAILYEHGVLQDLGVLPGDVSSEARAINARGDIVGISITSALLEHAALWQEGHIVALGTLPGDRSSAAWGIDNAGRIWGESRPSQFESRPFLWHDGVMRELTELEQPGVGFSFTRDEIAAWRCPDPANKAKPRPREGVIAWVPCPIESPDEVFPDIEDVNSSGQAVGTVGRRLDLDRKEFNGYLWSGGKRLLLPAAPGTAEPRAINDRGEIVGNSSVGTTLWTIK